MPFLAETMYQNLMSPVRSEGKPARVRPPVRRIRTADETLIDRQLSEDMDALLRLVSLGWRRGTR